MYQSRTYDMKGYSDILKQIEAVPDVIAASPFIFKQVLISSKSSVQGVILRGIQSDKEIQVTDLQANMKFGDLAGLQNPLFVPPDSEHSISDQPKASPKNRPGIFLAKNSRCDLVSLLVILLMWSRLSVQLNRSP